MISEPDVTFTDYGLAIECALFTYLIHRQGDLHRPLRNSFALFFGSVGTAALTGGTVHGFFLDASTIGYAILWPSTLIAIGVSALAGWVIGATLLFPVRVARGVSILAAAGFIIYCIAVLSISQTFLLAVVNYLPAAIFLSIAFAIVYARQGQRPVLVGLAGMALTFVAAGVQQTGIALHPVYFNHNALYHLIQAVALLMIFWSARSFVEGRART